MTTIENLPAPKDLLVAEEDPQIKFPERDDQEYLLGETAGLVDSWLKSYDHALKYSQWDDCTQHILEQARQNDEVRNLYYKDTPVIHRAMGHINNLFGNLPSALNATLNLSQNKEAIKFGENPHLTDPESLRNSIESAQWQGDAIWSLLRFRNYLLNPEGDSPSNYTITQEKTLPNILLKVLTEMSPRIFGKASPELEGKILSGIYGPVKLARVARKANYHLALPPAIWDAEGKIDLLIYNDKQTKVTPVQVKTTSKAERWDFDAGDKDVNNKDPRSWAYLKEYCSKISQNPHWKGIDFSPIWVNIFNAHFDMFGWKAVLGEKVPEPQANLISNVLEKPYGKF